MGILSILFNFIMNFWLLIGALFIVATIFNRNVGE